MSDTLSYLKQQNVSLSTQQVQILQFMNLTLTDLRNIDVSSSEFTELCQELQLSFGPKIKLKSAIIRLQSHKNQPPISHKFTQDSTENKTDDSDLQTLISMGFTAQQGIFALEASQQDIIKAIETLTTSNTIKNAQTKPICDQPIESSITSNTTKDLETKPICNQPIITPIGSIVAWYKHFGQQTLSLPDDSWIECNGQIINDPQSIFDGQKVPDINGERRFLRGGNQSGVIEEDEIKKHTHSGNFQIKGGNVENICWNLGARSTWKSGPVSETGGDETRPKNMSVIWIMRIK